MSNDTEIDNNWCLNLDDEVILSSSTYDQCNEKLLTVIRNYSLSDVSRNYFTVPEPGGIIKLNSYPKNFTTSYDRVDLIASIYHQ